MRGVDGVICEFPLPVEEVEACMTDPPNWEEVEFQTDSFNNKTFWYDSYTVEEDGTIYKKVMERELGKAPDGFSELKEVENGIERIDFTGELELFGMHFEEKFDFNFEIKILYYKGEVKEVELSEWHKVDNSARKETQQKMEKLQEKFQNRKKKWWYPLGQIFNLLIGLFFGSVRYVLGWIVKICWFVENSVRFKS